jgi:hypothetical protein
MLHENKQRMYQQRIFEKRENGKLVSHIASNEKSAGDCLPREKLN